MMLAKQSPVPMKEIPDFWDLVCLVKEQVLHGNFKSLISAPCMYPLVHHHSGFNEIHQQQRWLKPQITIQSWDLSCILYIPDKCTFITEKLSSAQAPVAFWLNFAVKSSLLKQ